MKSVLRKRLQDARPTLTGKADFLAQWNAQNNLWGPIGTTDFACPTCRAKASLAPLRLVCAPCGSTGFVTPAAVDAAYTRHKIRHHRRLTRWKRRQRRLELLLQTVRRDDLALIGQLLGRTNDRR